MRSLRFAITLGWAVTLLPVDGDAFARIWRVNAEGTADQPTIQAAVSAAVAGDTVLVAAGIYTWSRQGTGTPYGLIRVARDATGFAIISEGGPQATILDGERRGRLFFISGYNEILIQGFTITRGQAPRDTYNGGGGLIGHLSSPTIRNCVFVDNTAVEPGDDTTPPGSGGALWYGGISDLVVEDCVFRQNRAMYGGAVTVVNSTGNSVFRRCTFDDNDATERGGAFRAVNFRFTLEECLLLNNASVNWGGAVYLVEVDQTTHPSRVHRCTLVGNGGSTGGGIQLYASDLTVTNTIIANSTRGGAVRIEQGGILTIGCCDLFGNAGGDAIPLGSSDQGGNFTADPRFCQSLGLRPHGLRPDSPCAPGNHPGGSACEQIGAFPPSCAIQEQRSWGFAKDLYRPRR